MATYDINIKGEVDPKLKKGMQELAEETEGVAEATEKGEQAFENLSETAEEKTRVLKDLAKAIGKLKRETVGLSKSDEELIKLLGSGAEGVEEYRTQLSKASKSTGALTKATDKLTKANHDILAGLNLSAVAAGKAKTAFKGLWSEGLEDTKEFGKELRHIRDTTKSLTKTLEYDKLSFKTAALNKRRSLKALREVGVIPDIAPKMKANTRAVEQTNRALEGQLGILSEIASKVAGSETVDLRGIPGRTVGEELSRHIENVRKLGEAWKKTKLWVDRYGTVMARVGKGVLPASALPQIGSESFAERSVNELRGLGRRIRDSLAMLGGGGGGGGQITRTAAEMDKLKRSTDKLATSARRTRSTWADMITAFNTSYYFFKEMIRNIRFLVRGFLNLTDGVIRFQNKIRISTRTTSDFNKVISELRRLQRETGQPIENIGLIFQRFRVSLDALGLDSDTLIEYTRTLTRTTAIYGLATNEAAGAIRQFTQGLAAGTLRGHELYAVLEQIPPLAQEIAAALGVFTSDLRALGEQGKLTTPVLLEGMDRLRARVERDIKLLQLSPKQLLRVGEEGFADLLTKGLEDTGAMSWMLGALKTMNEYVASIVEKARSGEPVFKRLADTIKDVANVIYKTLLAIVSLIGGVVVIRFISWAAKLVKSIRALGGKGVLDKLTGAIKAVTKTEKTGTGLFGLATAGAIGTGVFTTIEDYVTNFLEKLNETIRPAADEFAALMKQRDSMLSQTKTLAETLWALRRKDPADLGVTELKEIRNMMQLINSTKEEMMRTAPVDAFRMFGPISKYNAYYQLLGRLEQKSLDNIERLKREGEKLPMEIRNFFESIDKGILKNVDAIHKKAIEFEKRIMTHRLKTGDLEAYPKYLREVREKAEETATGKGGISEAERRRRMLRERDLEIKADAKWLRGKPGLPAETDPFKGVLPQYKAREMEISPRVVARELPKVEDKDSSVAFVKNLDKNTAAQRKYNEVILNAAIAERALQKIQAQRIDTKKPNYMATEEKHLKKQVALRERMIAYQKDLNAAEQTGIDLLRSVSRDSLIYKRGAPVSDINTHWTVGESAGSVLNEKTGKLEAASFEQFRGLQREGVEALITRLEEVMARYQVFQDKPFDEAKVRDLVTRKVYSPDSKIAKEVKEASKLGRNLRQQINYADQTEEAVKKAREEAEQFANTVGGSVLNAFKQVVDAADLFGSRWGSVVNVIIDEVGRLVVELIAAQQAAAAAKSAFDKGQKGQQAGYETLTSQEGVTKTGFSAAMAGIQTGSLVAAGVTIGGAVLSALLKSDKDDVPAKEKYDDSLARERFRAALAAHVQRQKMIALQLRTALAVENAERIANKAQALAARNEALRLAAERRAYGAHLRVQTARRVGPAVEAPIAPLPTTAPTTATPTPAPATPVPPSLVPSELPMIAALTSGVEEAMSPIIKRFRADTEQTTNARTERAFRLVSPSPSAAPQSGPTQPMQPISVVVVDSEAAAEDYARSNKGRALIMNALEANRGDIKEMLI